MDRDFHGHHRRTQTRDPFRHDHLVKDGFKLILRNSTGRRYRKFVRVRGFLKERMIIKGMINAFLSEINWRWIDEVSKWLKCKDRKEMHSAPWILTYRNTSISVKSKKVVKNWHFYCQTRLFRLANSLSLK